MSFVKSLSELGLADLTLAGGKAASLGDAISAGFPVPPGFCLTTDAYRAFAAANDLQTEILRLGKSIQADDPDSLEAASAQLRVRFTDGKIPPDLEAEIRSAYTQLRTSHFPLPTLPVAVRSSATAEDLPDASFAGQQDTFLNIIGEESVLEAVRQCWASLWTGRAIAYRQREGIPLEETAMAVVVQQLIPADAAGVLFTANPMTGAQDEAVINAAWGLGEAVVSGLVTPDEIVVDKATGKIKEQRIADKQVMTARTASGVVERPVPTLQRNIPTLSAAQVAELADLARRIESHSGRPMDVEWAISDGHLFLLQSRPVTVMAPDLMGMDWSRNAIIERFPHPIVPFVWSGDKEQLPKSFKATFRLLGVHLSPSAPLLNLFYSRLYINMTLLRKAFEKSPINPPFDSDHSAPPKIRFTPAMLGMIARFLKITLSNHGEWERALPPYLEAVKKESARDWEALPTADVLEGMARQAQRRIELMAIHTDSYFATEVTTQALRTLTRSWLGDHDGRIATTLFSGLTGNKTMETNRALWQLADSTRGNDVLRQAISEARYEDWRERIARVPGGAKFVAGFDAFLKTYGHRSPRYELNYPTWRERPDQALDLLRLYLNDGTADPGEGEARKAAEREAATRAARQRLSLWQRPIFDFLLRLTQIYHRLRENQQFYMLTALPMQRRMILTLAERLHQAGMLREVEDVFFLEYTEVRALANQVAGLPTNGDVAPAAPLQLAMKRRAEFARHSKMAVPYILANGAKASASHHSDGALRGIPVSRGFVTGKARLIHGAEDFSKFRPGEILVAPTTTPAWTPLFSVAAGLVTNYGGLLSHAGVVAREYGLPAVLGVADATRLIRDGDEVTVDGERGEVRVNGKSHHAAASFQPVS